MKTVENLKRRYADFQALDARDKKTFWKEFALNKMCIRDRCRANGLYNYG